MKKICIVCGKKAELFINRIFDDRYGAPGLYNIYRCRYCGFGFLNPQIKRTEIGEFYNKYYPLSGLTSEDVRNSANIKSALYTWLTGTNNTTHLYIKPNSIVLDIGSASGQSLIEITKLKGEAFGVEPDPGAQKIAKDLNLNVYKGLITNNPYPGKKFDFITASQVLEHDPNPQTFLKAAEKKLKKDGILILSFPNCDSIYRRIFKKRWINWHVPYHCNFFTKASFIKIAKLTGLKVIKMKTITPNLWTILQMKRLFTKPVEGKKDEFWKVQDEVLDKVVFCRQTLLTVILKLLINIIMVILIPVNRITDLFGQGDSFIIFLKKDEKES